MIYINTEKSFEVFHSEVLHHTNKYYMSVNNTKLIKVVLLTDVKY